jgi:2-methylcitrate dehydratase PrpD
MPLPSYLPEEDPTDKYSADFSGVSDKEIDIMNAARTMTENMINIHYDDIPADVTDFTKKHILDYLGVALGGSSRPGIRELYEIIADWGGKEESTVLCFGHKVPAPNAAQVNASMGHALDYDDTGDGPTHPSVVIVPTCLAVAERKGNVSGKEFITAVTLGMDMMCRLGQAFRSGIKSTLVKGHPGAGWHLTCVFGFIAAAGAAGKLMDLDEETLHNALGIAYHQSSGNGQCVTEGALTKRMGPGFAARGGIVSALMAQKGITGAREFIDGEVGLYNLYFKGEYDPEPLTANLGKYFAGTTAGMKPHPCCKGTHDYVDVATTLVEKYKLKAEDIKEVIIFCTDETNFLLHPLKKRSRPENPVDSQFSVPWAVAVVLLRGKAGVGDFTEEAIRNPEILRITDMVRVVRDDSLVETKGMCPAKIGVTTADGRTFIEQSGAPVAGAGNDSPLEVYERKFRDCASYSIKPLPGERIDAIIDKIKNLESVDNISEIIDLLS